MRKEFIEKEIYINKNDKILLKIDNKISTEKITTITKEFKILIKQLRKTNININSFNNTNFDYIIVMLIIVHCTNLFKNKKLNIQTISSTYKDLFKKGILQQISLVFLDPYLKIKILEIMMSCDMIINCEKMLYQDLNLKKEAKLMQSKSIGFKKNTNKKNDNFDQLLDQYNDFMRLADLLDDKMFKRKAKNVLNKMKKKYKLNETELYNENIWEKENLKIISEKEVDLIYQKIESKTNSIDKLLDEYNDTMLLYKTFGGSVYKTKMTRIKNKIKKIIEKNK